MSLHEEDHGKLFPDTNRSRDVLDALLRELHASGAMLSPATRDRRRHQHARRVPPRHRTRRLSRRDVVVLATGGQSLPKTGSDGAGLAIARRLGHTIVPTTPALVPLTLDADGRPAARASRASRTMSSSRCGLTVRVATRLAGALLWTHFGVSGPVVLNASRHWLRAELDGRAVRADASTCCGGQAFERVDATLTSLARRSSAHLARRLPSRRSCPASIAAAVLAARSDWTTRQPLAHLARDRPAPAAHALVEWPLAVTGSRGYNYAEATAGGVALEEIDPATMESRRCPGLYLVGEMLDVDGRIGGFNFQWAWSSAHVAARAIAS